MPSSRNFACKTFGRDAGVEFACRRISLIEQGHLNKGAADEPNGFYREL